MVRQVHRSMVNRNENASSHSETSSWVTKLLTLTVATQRQGALGADGVKLTRMFARCTNHLTIFIHMQSKDYMHSQGLQRLAFNILMHSERCGVCHDFAKRRGCRRGQNLLLCHNRKSLVGCSECAAKIKCIIQ